MGNADLPLACGDAHKKAFERLGYIHDRTKGSHHIMTKPGCNSLSIPCKKGVNVKRGLLASLLKAAVGVTEAEYLVAFKN